MEAGSVSSIVAGPPPDDEGSRRLVAGDLEHAQRESLVARNRLAAAYVHDELRQQLAEADTHEELLRIGQTHGFVPEGDAQKDTIRGAILHHVMHNIEALPGHRLAALANTEKATLYWARVDAARERLDARVAQARHLESERMY